ncbi:hypothetical protein ElyMa_003306000 [Elysia marginata]|uniref:Uncharacterized protein n=1 Tax=Elysia marginata TaxID=1093978 RepID=A0AAV4JF81_9GAST|nr:hypothetical protein ElyMa_003306000 [Elysia marginata]
MSLMEGEEAGAVGRRRVYGRLYAVWRAAAVGKGRVVWPLELREAVRETGGKGRVVWPLELREAVRETVKKEESEGAAGKYDSQQDCNQSVISETALGTIESVLPHCDARSACIHHTQSHLLAPGRPD